MKPSGQHVMSGSTPLYAIYVCECCEGSGRIPCLCGRDHCDCGEEEVDCPICRADDPEPDAFDPAYRKPAILIDRSRL